MCNSGVGLTPTLHGTTHHFSAGGLFNGLVLLTDDETGSWWDHITGEAVHGSLAGAVLESWPLRWMSVTEALRAWPDLTISRPQRSWNPIKAAMTALGKKFSGSKGMLPPGFRQTMAETDDRLPEMLQGLGVIVDGTARFYPMAALPVTDQWDGRALSVALSDIHVPEALWEEDGSRPMQLFSRWYGFSYTFPGCTIFGQ